MNPLLLYVFTESVYGEELPRKSSFVFNFTVSEQNSSNSDEQALCHADVCYKLLQCDPKTHLSNKF